MEWIHPGAREGERKRDITASCPIQVRGGNVAGAGAGAGAGTGVEKGRATWKRGGREEEFRIQ